MWGSWISRLLAAAAVALSMSCGQVAAQEGGGSDSIVVTLPADLDAAERRALIDALAALGRPVSVADERAQARELPPELKVAGGSEERRVGKECFISGRCWLLWDHS